MLIDGLTNAGAIPALELTLRFASQRQNILAHNIANASTPDFRPVEVDPGQFQRMLGRAIDERRSAISGSDELHWRESRDFRRDEQGSLRLNPRSPSAGILFHDRTNRDLERQMQDLAENTSMHRVAADLLRSRFDVLRSAIREVA